MQGAKLDLGALTSNPDTRVRTTPFKPVPGDPTRYAVKVTFPTDDSWVLVVRVSEPSAYVHLGYEAVSTGRAESAHHGAAALAANPSKRALLAANPAFLATYDPLTGIGATGKSAASAAASDAAHDHPVVASAGVTGREWGAVGVGVLLAVFALSFGHLMRQIGRNIRRHGPIVLGRGLAAAGPVTGTGLGGSDRRSAEFDSSDRRLV